MSTVILDAGHGGYDNGAVYQNRREKDDNLNLALAVGNILSQNGVNVLYTRTEDVYQSPFEKAQIANSSGANLLVSFHRNSSPYPNTYSGVETLIFNRGDEKETLAEDINQELSYAGYENLGINVRPGLAILRRSQMPALLIETGFINTDADNAIFDANFNAIATAIATAIMNNTTI